MDWGLVPQHLLPSKNEIWSAKVADLVRRAAAFGTVTSPGPVEMARVRQRRRGMVDGLIAMHLDHYRASGAELIMGAGSFVAPKTLEVRVATLSDSAVLRARTIAEPQGFMKALVEAQSDRFLGFTMLGPEAGEVMAVMQTAILAEMPYPGLCEAILTHPTMAVRTRILVRKRPAQVRGLACTLATRLP